MMHNLHIRTEILSQLIGKEENLLNVMVEGGNGKGEEFTHDGWKWKDSRMQVRGDGDVGCRFRFTD